jgi:hypothetical protein
LPRQLGFKGLVVLFDETGADLSIQSGLVTLSQQRQQLANLRNLVDQLATGGTPGCSVVYATTRDLVEIARQDYPALSQRMERREEMNGFAVPSRNPRAIWCRLDELTDPAPDVPEFYEELGKKLLSLAKDAGVAESRLSAERAKASDRAKKMSQNLAQAAVREFIKTVASNLIRN